VRRRNASVEVLHVPMGRMGWQIRTVWFAAPWVVNAVVLLVTVIGNPLAWVIVLVTGVWVLDRVVRGWLALNDARDI
jgi:uncharacterized membrane protein